MSYGPIETILVSSQIVASFRRGWAVLTKLSAHCSPSADSSSQPYQWSQEGEIDFSSRFWSSGLSRKNFPESLFWNPLCNLPLFPVVVKSYLLLSQPQSIATLSYLLFVNRNMVIQSNLNFKRSLVHSGVGSGENCWGALLLCLFPSTILSYFLLICSFKLCAKSSALLVWLCSVSTEFLWVYFYIMKSPCLVFCTFTPRLCMSTNSIQSSSWIVY